MSRGRQSEVRISGTNFHSSGCAIIGKLREGVGFFILGATVIAQIEEKPGPSISTAPCSFEIKDTLSDDASSLDILLEHVHAARPRVIRSGRLPMAM